MIDAAIQPIQQRVLAPVAAALVRWGVSADGLTLAGFGLGLLAIGALAAQAYGLALALILANRLCDGLDGAVARMTAPTDRGAFLDIALDFVFYALVPLGFALGDPAQNALPAAVLIAAFVGTGSSFLAFAAVAAKAGQAHRIPAKGIPYIGGLTEGFETIAIFVVMCLLPQYFALLAYGFAIACGLTTLSRWVQGWRTFAASGRPTRD